MTALFAGVALGIAGGAHCAGMCGPFIAVVAPRGRRAVLHHAARAMTYVLLGLAAGATGMSAVALGAGRTLTWLAAAGLILEAIRTGSIGGGPSTPVSRKNSAADQPIVTKQLRALTNRVAGISKTHPIAGAVSMGAVNGLLPCGLVYSAAISAIGWGDALTGAIFMAGFAIGTTAVLAAAGVVWAWMRTRLPRFAHGLTPLALVLIAILLVLRAGPAAHVH